MVHALSLLVLAAVFVVATTTPVNMGIVAFLAAFLVGGLSGVGIEAVLGFFPGDVFVLVVGITLLFGVARVNGTIDLVVSASLRLVRGRRWAVVWLMFALAAVLMSLGSVLAVGMLAPIAMPVAERYRINPLLMGMMLSHGALSAAFSPITVYGAFTTGMVARAGLDVSPLLLFAVPFALNVAFAVVLFLVLGRDLLKREDDRVGPVEEAEPAGGGGAATLAPPVAGTAVLRAVPVTPRRVLTLTGMAALLVSGLLGADVGVTAFVVGSALLLVSPNRHQDSMKDVAWSAVLLVCGMLTYMAVLKENGTLALLGEGAAALGSPLLAALLLCLAVAVLSAFGSSIGTLGIALPLALPLLELGGIGAAGFVVALGFCSTVVDVSPFSTNGIIVLAQARVDDKQRFQRRMLAYGGLVVLVAPVLAWSVAVLPTS
ncbi:UIT1 family transporter [Saccharopolyspora erythraea NRRL 2338]|uniref:Dicarboxylate carrier protein n=2 Tax=Saccharopolyspora erythraea TaxID=1836 RepID=A4FE45_SACEN|nr:SLC13 family permease [Saccharopolyspora erythraea]EQD82859.1 C4-dicarboxylate ABC transporter [Saccharopolyspora erythraea D]PFG96047.1 UIT1 family transporter [Saccharopolyspora erythraea NRRL 2338]QRK92595.1 C4-dicarboxylate ABC transporter [Saccharopolyspora erythraea]CAM02320.1 dicarboxylate carrier protein [Saccharopolyspora erythraea NRRL 2338]